MSEIRGLRFSALTPEHWSDFEKLFGDRGACGGCWCMWWRPKRTDFMKQRGERNRQAMKGMVDSGEVPGILAYSGDQSIGWCAIAPREKYPALKRSRLLGPIDDKPVWSVTCFFVDKRFRRRGLMSALLAAGVEHAKTKRRQDN